MVKEFWNKAKYNRAFILSVSAMILLIAVAVIGPGLGHLILILSLLWWTKYARLTRNLLIRIRASEYITEAQLGGERQRIGIARIMLTDPDIIVMDEPTISQKVYAHGV